MAETPIRHRQIQVGGLNMHVAEAGEHREVVPGAAADLEDAGVARQRDLAFDQVGEDVAPRAIPPVRAVMLRHPVVDDALHQRKTH